MKPAQQVLEKYTKKLEQEYPKMLRKFFDGKTGRDFEPDLASMADVDLGQIPYEDLDKIKEAGICVDIAVEERDIIQGLPLKGKALVYLYPIEVEFDLRDKYPPKDYLKKVKAKLKKYPDDAELLKVADMLGKVVATTKVIEDLNGKS